ncbi:NAD(P)/FAD-dependent oxidoreductase [Halocola ammonii]
MKSHYQIAIIGGGLAGLVNAIDLSQRGYSVVLFEKDKFPKHKVCGEFVSNEIRPYLNRLGAFPTDLNVAEIDRLEISDLSGKVVGSELDLAGFGISRFAFDDHLADVAQKSGAEVLINERVKQLAFDADHFFLKTRSGVEVKAQVVIGAFGKRSNLDKELDRSFMQKRTSYVGVKCHYESDFQENLVQLHNFNGGYCGLSKVETGAVNLCYLVDQQVLEKYSGIEEMEMNHLAQNPHLKSFFENSSPIFKSPLVISQINFDPKPVVEDHVMMSGDSAGLIHPFCGNGMAMAIHSAQICSDAIHQFLSGNCSREEMEKSYGKAWKNEFGSRLYFGRKASKLFGKPRLTGAALGLMRTFPPLLGRASKMAHGKPVE